MFGKRVYLIKFRGKWVEDDESEGVEREGASTVRLKGDAHDALQYFQLKYPTLIIFDIKRVD